MNIAASANRGIFTEIYETYIYKNTATGIALGTVLSILAVAIGNVMGSMTIWEVLAVTTSFYCTSLCVTQNRLQYIFGIISVGLYSYIFWVSGLFALSIFNGLLVLSLVYGWYRWKSDSVAIKVTYASWKEWIVYGLYGIMVAGLFLLIFDFFEADFLKEDILIATLSAVAQLLLDRKNRETWIIWLIVNVLSMRLFLDQEMYLVFIQYIFFTANVFFGWFSWKVESK